MMSATVDFTMNSAKHAYTCLQSVVCKTPFLLTHYTSVQILKPFSFYIRICNFLLSIYVYV